MIKAECHSDDRLYEAHFDATQWFNQASDTEIKALGKCGWGGDYAADEVAMFMADKHEDVTTMFKYVELARKREPMGFECHVDEDDARLWLVEYKPHLLVIDED